MSVIFYRKKILEILSKTTLVVMMDDPLISTNLGEFLNQIQKSCFKGQQHQGCLPLKEASYSPPMTRR